jgi:uncharacterized phiE125 gp8 family phage protein
MMPGGTAEAIVSLAEAQAFARVETGEEEALLAGFVRTASGLCEAFLGQAVIERPFTEAVAASAQWQRLNAAPVRAVDALSKGGTPLPVSSYSVDVDSSGSGWIRIVDASVTGVVEVSGTAGMATARNDVPEPIRQGVLRLVAHLFSCRDGEGGAIPAAVTALWRPYRQMRIA